MNSVLELIEDAVLGGTCSVLVLDVTSGDYWTGVSFVVRGEDRANRFVTSLIVHGFIEHEIPLIFSQAMPANRPGVSVRD